MFNSLSPEYQPHPVSVEELEEIVRRFSPMPPVHIFAKSPRQFPKGIRVFQIGTDIYMRPTAFYLFKKTNMFREPLPSRIPRIHKKRSRRQ